MEAPRAQVPSESAFSVAGNNARSLALSQPLTDPQTQPETWQEAITRNKRLVGAAAVVVLVVLTSLILSIVALVTAENAMQRPEQFPRVPPGVNVGGWLNLEDWFYSGVGGTHVSTGSDFPDGQGACLPPRLTQLDGYRWSSEGNLTYRLLNLTGSKTKVAEIFMAHRRSFIGNYDLKVMADSGIKYIRAPLNWGAFADALDFLDKDEYGSHDPENDAVLVMDPYYRESHAFITTPRKWLADFIRNAGKNGMSVLVDMHAFPGGSSDGTYNGVWPARPKFWTESVNSTDNTSFTLQEVGQRVVQKMISWLEHQDQDVIDALHGVTVMNEPAHLSAGKDWASEEGVLEWLKDASQTFRASSLPGKSVRLYMNIIETAFKDFTGTVKPWFESTFSDKERSSWAVIDKHYYMAWGAQWSSGRVSDGGKYHCDQAIDDIRDTLRTTIQGFTEGFKKDFPDSLRACTEFSVGTYDLATEACTDPLVVQTFLDEQVGAFSDAGITGFFWTWRMPYGPTFEPGWSLKYVLGHEIQRPNVLACLPPTTPTPTPETPAPTPAP